MNIEDFRNYCLSKPGVEEDFPFDETTLVFKVMGKMFALTDLEDDFSANLKCDPEQALALREKHPGEVLPGYHMNKRHWNTIMGSSRLSDAEFRYWIDHSYKLVVTKLPKKLQLELKKKPE